MEATLTSDKDFKHLVRAEARRSGSSYTAARRRLLEKQTGDLVDTDAMRQVEKPELGFSLWVPDDWAEFPPQPTNSPYEVARFQYNDGTGHLCLVFRHPGSTGLSPLVPAQLVRRDREGKHFENFVLTETQLGGLPAVRMDYETTRFAKGKYFVRDYFVVARNVVLEFALGTYTPESDAPVFDEMAARFRVL